MFSGDVKVDETLLRSKSSSGRVLDDLEIYIGCRIKAVSEVVCQCERWRKPIHLSFTVEFFKDIATNISDQREANHSGTSTSFQSRFSMFDKILQYMMISFSNSGALDISQRWHKRRPVLVLESPKLLLISFCIPAILSFIFLNKWSWPGPVTVNSWVRDLATGQFGLKAAE